MWLPWPKATVLVVSGPAHDPDRMHLYILLTHGLGEAEECLLVCIQSIAKGQFFDNACVLNPGDHPFVRHPSFVRYDRCRKEQQAKLLKAVESGVMVPRDPVSDDVYERICEGLRNSLHAPPWAKEWLHWHDNLAD